MNMTNDQKKRAVTEFAALERKLDTVLFARNDDDDDDNNLLKAGATVAGVGGVVGAGYGVNALTKQGKRLNEMPRAVTKSSDIPGVEGDLPGPIDSMAARRGFVMRNTGGTATTIERGASKGFLGDLKTGAGALAGNTKTAGKDVIESLTEAFKRLRGLKAAV
jgi:hypothetical protein